MGYYTEAMVAELTALKVRQVQCLLFWWFRVRGLRV